MWTSSQDQLPGPVPRTSSQDQLPAHTSQTIKHLGHPSVNVAANERQRPLLASRDAGAQTWTLAHSCLRPGSRAQQNLEEPSGSLNWPQECAGPAGRERSQPLETVSNELRRCCLQACSSQPVLLGLGTKPVKPFHEENPLLLSAKLQGNSEINIIR